MGQIGGMIMPLHIPNPLQGLVRRKRFLGQDRGQQQQGLPEGQCWCPFFNCIRTRTRKGGAKRHRVI
jgi:hypothetical protein